MTAKSANQKRDVIVATSELISLLQGTNRFPEALAEAEKMPGLVHDAGLGPWSQLAAEGQRIQILSATGHHLETLEIVKSLRPRMEELIRENVVDGAVNSWNVLESILGHAHLSARRTQQWELSLELGEEIASSKFNRGAPVLERAKSRFDDYGPLVSLGRLVEARELVDECRQIFEDEGDIAFLGRAFCSLAELSVANNHNDEAIEFQEQALRMAYILDNPESCSIDHFNLANCIEKVTDTTPAVIAHELAGIILAKLTTSIYLADMLPVLGYALAIQEQAAPRMIPTLTIHQFWLTRVEGEAG